MSYTVMSDEILKEFDSKIYFAVAKIRNDRKCAEINAIHKEVTKTPKTPTPYEQRSGCTPKEL